MSRGRPRKKTADEIKISFDPYVKKWFKKNGQRFLIMVAGLAVLFYGTYYFANNLEIFNLITSEFRDVEELPKTSNTDEKSVTTENLQSAIEDLQKKDERTVEEIKSDAELLLENLKKLQESQK